VQVEMEAIQACNHMRFAKLEKAHVNTIFARSQDVIFPHRIAQWCIPKQSGPFLTVEDDCYPADDLASFQKVRWSSLSPNINRN
jgi:hypothetical protein